MVLMASSPKHPTLHSCKPKARQSLSAVPRLSASSRVLPSNSTALACRLQQSCALMHSPTDPFSSGSSSPTEPNMSAQQRLEEMEAQQTLQGPKELGPSWEHRTKRTCRSRLRDNVDEPEPAALLHTPPP